MQPRPRFLKIQYINRATGEIKTETPPAEKLLKFLYANPIGKATLLPIVTKKIISETYGRFMKSPSSKKRIQPFINEYDINMEECVRKSNEFESFNDFFVRKLKPNARPIQSGLVSPADGRLLAFNEISQLQKFFIKGSEFTLPKFLHNPQLAKDYEKSAFVIIRLAPNDYHRYHFPLSGKAGKTQIIKGNYYSVSPYALASNFAKVFCENKRAYCELVTETGKILIAPVGATMVGSIHQTYTPKNMVNKGQEMGYFSFGGSTIVLLVPKSVASINKDLITNTQNNLETFVKMGEQIAH